MMRLFQCIRKYVFAFLATVFSCVLFLILASMVPQTYVHMNVGHSAAMLNSEGVYIRFADYDATSQLDNYSEALMLMEADLMTVSDIKTVFTNPLKVYEGDMLPTVRLYRYMQGEEPIETTSYNRYWMGFRGVLRPLLMILDLAQIRFHVAIAFFTMFAALLIDISKRTNSYIAMLFALSMALVRPYVIGISLQFSCCFFIAFIAMLLVPWIANHANYEGLFFMEIGMLTMFFDFYTTPIITFGLPATYLYLLYANREEKYPVLRMIKNAGIWMGSYLSMWLAKLLLTELFTSEPAFAPAFNKALFWLGAQGYSSDELQYSATAALEGVVKSVAVDNISRSLACAFFAVVVIVILIKYKKGIITPYTLKRHFLLLVIALLPIVWFAVAAEPTTIHFWFQYRGIVVFLWSFGVYLTLIFNKKSKEI